MRIRVRAFCLSLLLAGAASAADSLNVRLIGSCDMPVTVHSTGVAVHGDYAYLACRVDQPDTVQGLHVISIADPTQPVEVGCCITPRPAYGVAVEGGYAYVADDNAGLRVISVADPAHPVEVGYCDTFARAMAVAVSGDYAYAADMFSHGLRVISVADPAHPAQVGYCASLSHAGGVAVSGTYAYVAGTDFNVISVADPAHPVEVGELQGRGGGCVAVNGYYAYVGRLVIRIADPAHPVEVWTTGGGGNGVAVAGNHEYVAAGAFGLEVFSLADPGSPAEVGFYRQPGRDASAVTVAGDYAYVAYDLLGLQIFQYYEPGVEDSPKPQAASHKLAATIVCGVLFLAERASTSPSPSLLDISGRKVMELQPGANDVSRLSPGVYFVRSAREAAAQPHESAVGRQPSAITKVIVAR